MPTEKTGCHPAQKAQGQGRAMLPGLASWARGLCRHSPRGLPKGHEAWAFCPVRQGSGMNLADCPDHAEGLDSQGPHARDWRKSRTFPLAQCGPQREIPGSRPQRRWTAPGSVCLWVSCWSPGAWPPARSDRRTDSSRRVRFPESGNRC